MKHFIVFIITSLFLRYPLPYDTFLNRRSSEICTMNYSVLLDESTRNEIEYTIKKGLIWLESQQKKNGSFKEYPAITALVLSAFMRSPFNITILNPRVYSGFRYLLQHVQSDGSICLIGDKLKNYNTSICLIAFKDANSLEFKPIIQNAELYIMNSQFSEECGYTTDSLAYGGLGYGEKTRGDLSNFQWGIEALQIRQLEIEKPKTSREKSIAQKKEKFYQRALVFLSKCQNLKSIDPEKYTGDDGGFMYEPGKSKAGGTRSYGTMTYAGLKSMIYAKVAKNDQRVIAAYKWICENYNLTAVPAMENGSDGLYYYYHTMAKALQALGRDIIIDSNNEEHSWRNELALQLIRKQKPEGHWINENPRWREDDPILVTAYVILALEEILDSAAASQLLPKTMIK